MTTSPLAPEPPAVPAEAPFVHYYDQHPTAEDLMGSSAIQGELVRYLVQVLSWLYRVEGWFVAADLNLYRVKRRDEYPVAPDVALFQGVVLDPATVRQLRSWRLYEPDRPPPTVVFAIASDTTWETDLYEKPAKYAALGVQEYYAYDPNEPGYFPPAQGRLRAWQRVQHTLVEQAPDAQGRVWSPALQSFLVPAGGTVGLVDATGARRLTQAEAAQAAQEAADRRAAAEQVARAQAEARAAAEQAAKEAEQAARAQAEARAAAEQAAKEAAWARLRALGIDPTTLEHE